ncbi:MAG TPA: SHOCT domain-containing protein [Telluria sp.]|jgi:hypothetical protein
MAVRLKFSVMALFLAGCLGACATSEIVPIGTDSYMIAQTSAGGVFKAMSSLKSEVIQRANAFAESKGKIAIPIAAKEAPAYPGHMPSFEYQFRLVDKNDPRASGGGLIPRADVVVENRVVPPGTGVTRTQDGKDIYSELIKLDELRKRGLLTEAEFQVQKERLLSGK